MRRFAILLALAVVLGGALVVAPSQAKPAEAYVHVGGSMKLVRSAQGLYDIDALKACRQQRGAYIAMPMDVWNPYTWECFNVSQWYPHRWVWRGGIDMGRYCRENHPDSPRAVLHPHVPVMRAFAWECSR